jgi:hypothetical protein
LNQQRNAILASAICDIIAALNRAGMTPLLMKGAANLLDGLYPDPSARVIGDIDVLVPPDAVNPASQVLAGIGYRAEAEQPSPPYRWIVIAPNPHHHLPPRTNEQTGAGGELHRELVPFYLARLINGKEAMARALLRNRGGMRYHMLSPTDRVLHNIVHALAHAQVYPEGYKTGPADLRRVDLQQIDLRQRVDLALLIKECGSEINWLEIRGRFASARTLAVLHGHVSLLQEMFGGTFL